MDKPTLLIVDDDQPNLTIFKAMYMRQYNVLTALSAEEGWKLLEAHDEITVVFSDLRMPKIDGIEFIQKAQKDHPKIPFIIFSGSDVSEQMEDAIGRGVVEAFLKKPFDYGLLNDIIQKYAVDNSS